VKTGLCANSVQIYEPFGLAIKRIYCAATISSPAEPLFGLQFFWKRQKITRVNNQVLIFGVDGMKQLTLKTLFAGATLALAMNVQAADSVYDQCVADGNTIIELTKEKSAKAGREYEQKTTLKECYAELNNIEAKYGDATKGVNPYSVMDAADRKKWSTLFEAIDVKQYRGTPYRMASYYFGGQSK
jgi:hypothetical protein